MAIIERMTESGQAVMDQPANDNQGDEHTVGTVERPPITSLLRRLRSTRTLRQVEADTGISNAYLSNIESGAKRPGVKILSKLAAYYRVPLQDLLEAAGLPFDETAAVLADSTARHPERLRVRNCRPRLHPVPEAGWNASPGCPEIRRSDVPTLHRKEAAVT